MILFPLQLFAIIDVLSLAATQAEGGEERPQMTITHTTVIESWTRSFVLLRHFLERDLKQTGCSVCDYLIELGCDSVKSIASKSVGDSLSSVQRVLPRLSRLMNILLAAADRDQTISMFQLLHKEVV